MPEEVENRKEINYGKTMERENHLEMVDVIQDNTRSGTKNSTKLILKRMKRNRMTIYLRQTRKMVMQEKRMTRQSTATITDIKCR